MLFSVFDYTTRQYAYYEGPGRAPTTGWFRVPRGKLTHPEVIAAALPDGAVPMGRGDVAKGVVAAPGVGLSGFVVDNPGVSLALAGGLVLLWWLWRESR